MAKRRRADAVQLDEALERECIQLVEQGVVPSARRLAQMLGCQPSTLTRDPVRAATIAKHRSEFEARKRWSKRLQKSSVEFSSELLQRKDMEIQSLQRQVDALLISHRAMIDFLRECGSYDTWRKFLSRYVEVETELVSLAALPD